MIQKIMLFIMAVAICVLGFVGIQNYHELNKVENELIETNQVFENTLLEQLVESLTVYDAKIAGEPLKLIRHGSVNDGGYVVPQLAFEKADALLGYGIANDISFEEGFSNKYNLPSYGFDCGVKNIKVSNPKCTFVSECIGSDKFLYEEQKSSMTVVTFDQQLKKYNLEDKKIFIKMDIEGAEYDAFDPILARAHQVTGIVLEIHFDGGIKQIHNAVNLLKKLQKDFLLLHVHGNNCVVKTFTATNIQGTLPKVVELTFVNKSLVNEWVLMADQSFPKSFDSPNCPNKPEYHFQIKNLQRH